MESSVEYYREDNEVRGKYTNLYYINNTFHFLTTNNTILLEKVRSILAPEDFIPSVIIFENNDKLNEYIHSIKFSIINGITCYFSHFYDWNIAHGLYDSLYPAYLTYLKILNSESIFNLFINLLHIPGWRFSAGASRDWTLDIFKKFAGGQCIVDNYEQRRITQNYIFDTLIIGHALAGITSVNKYGEMPGRDLQALEKFRNRMFSSYNIQPRTQINNEKLTIRVINCRRYSANERLILMKIIEELKNRGHDAEYINWENITGFRDQLEIMNRTDIHISGCGTSMLNFPFLNDNCVHINLGANPIVGCDIPGLMEVNISLLSNNITCDYYNIFDFKQILYEPLIVQINTHIYNLINKIKIPKIVPNYINTWRQICIGKNFDIFIKKMNGLISPHLMQYRWVECVVYKYGPFEGI